MLSLLLLFIIKKIPLNHRLTASFVRNVTWSFCSVLYEALTSAEMTYSSLVKLVYCMARTPLHCGCSCRDLRVKRRSRDRKRVSICQTLKPAIGCSCFLLVCSTKRAGAAREKMGWHIRTCTCICMTETHAGGSEGVARLHLFNCREISPWGKAFRKAADTNLGLRVKAVVERWEAKGRKGGNRKNWCKWVYWHVHDAQVTIAH